MSVRLLGNRNFLLIAAALLAGRALPRAESCSVMVRRSAQGEQ